MGWKGESRRHSLSRKGIKTNLPDGRRFDVSNFVARGNREIVEGKIRAMGHTISYWYEIWDAELDIDDQLKESLEEQAEDRAREMIAEDYIQGELNAYYVHDDNDYEINGWWSIE